MYRGSRKHVLDWVERPRFLPELLELVQPVTCRITSESHWQPLGYREPTEARLDAFGERAMPNHTAWPILRRWWLRHEKGANTPNWDIALSCEVESKPGLILVEAKANEPELGDAGKRRDAKASPTSDENHDQIVAAIDEARMALEATHPGISIGCDSHYQFSNRIAFAWKLASLGVPTVLVYLGFTGDEGIRDVGEPFANQAHWQTVFETHVRSVCPRPFAEAPVHAGQAPFWVLVRSRPVLQRSSPAI